MSIPDLTSGELTTLVNACHEAAAWRAENKLPHVEKLVQMEEKLKRYNDELDKKIDEKCGELLEEAEQKKKLSKDWDQLEKDLAETLS
jgi:predicted transcriptional regulator